ncbi:hypothetical protein D9M71_441520 [compost metagenome]
MVTGSLGFSTRATCAPEERLASSTREAETGLPISVWTDWALQRSALATVVSGCLSVELHPASSATEKSATREARCNDMMTS